MNNPNPPSKPNQKAEPSTDLIISLLRKHYDTETLYLDDDGVCRTDLEVVADRLQALQKELDIARLDRDGDAVNGQWAIELEAKNQEIEKLTGQIKSEWQKDKDQIIAQQQEIKDLSKKKEITHATTNMTLEECFALIDNQQDEIQKQNFLMVQNQALLNSSFNDISKLNDECDTVNRKLTTANERIKGLEEGLRKYKTQEPFNKLAMGSAKSAWHKLDAKNKKLKSSLTTANQRIKELEDNLEVEIAINQARMKLHNQDDITKLYHGTEVERLTTKLTTSKATLDAVEVTIFNADMCLDRPIGKVDIGFGRQWVKKALTLITKQKEKS